MLKHAKKSEKTDTPEAKKRINALIGIVCGVVKILLITTFLMIIFQNFGVNIDPILASAVIIGLAVGLAT